MGKVLRCTLTKPILRQINFKPSTQEAQNQPEQEQRYNQFVSMESTSFTKIRQIYVYRLNPPLTVQTPSVIRNRRVDQHVIIAQYPLLNNLTDLSLELCDSDDWVRLGSFLTGIHPLRKLSLNHCLDCTGVFRIRNNSFDELRLST